MPKPVVSAFTGFAVVNNKAEPSMNADLARQLVRRLPPRLKRSVGDTVASATDTGDQIQEALCETSANAVKRLLQAPLAELTQVAKSNGTEHGPQPCAEVVKPADGFQLSHHSQAQQQLFEQRQLAVLEIMNHMPELRRTIYVRRRVDGWSREKIAAEYHLSLESVRKHIYRAMVTLSVELASRGLVEVK